MKHVVIIGNGISGITAARHIRKLSDHKLTVISGETDHFFSRTALMYIYMGHMKYENTKPYEDWFWRKNNIELKRAWVRGVDFSNKLLTCDSGESMDYDVLVLALGARPNMPPVPGAELKGVQGMVSMQDLELMEKSTRGISQAAVIGGGLIGVEMVEMLMSRNIHTTFIVRELEFWSRVLPVEEAAMVNNHIREHHVDLRLQTEIEAILGDNNDRVEAVKLNDGTQVPCQFCGITIGVHPNIGWLKDTNLETDRGILVNEYLQTNVDDVYAIGDCAQHRNPLPNRPSVEQVWYTGRMQGETVARTITGNPLAYQPGNWFNSAKLFDIEYQVYSEPVFTPEDGHEHIFWKDALGKVSMRIVYKAESQRVIYIGTLGWRLRHEVCNRWITQKRSIEYVLTHLRDANFDPEFYRQYEQEVINVYNQQTGKNLMAKKKSWQRILS